MKAHELIDSPEKWWDGKKSVWEQWQPENTNCALQAIATAYGDIDEAEAAERRLIKATRQSIPKWNDTHTWEEVYSTMKALDI